MKITHVILLSLIILLSSVYVVHADENITFTTTGSTFAPSINVTGSPTVLWTFSDGTTSNSTNPSINFGSAAQRNQTLKVTPWNAVTKINIGYDGSDGGTAFHGTGLVTKATQNVKAVYGLENINQSLVVWASSKNTGITDLNFTGFSNLTAIEVFACDGLTNLTLVDLPKIDRVCAEACAISVMNYTGLTSLQDIRLANQDGHLTAINFQYPVNNWHVCCHTNPGLTTRIPVENFTNVTELMIQSDNQSGELIINSTRLSFVYANDNHYTTANLSGKFPNWSKTVRLQDNDLTHVDITGCQGLYIFNLTNNNLNQSEVDYILTTMNGYKHTYGYNLGDIRIAGNTAPSLTGLLAAVDLDLGKTVTIDVPQNLVFRNESTRIWAVNNTITNINGSVITPRTLASISNSLNNSTEAGIFDNVTFIPSSDINISIIEWSGINKTWNESCTISNATTRHIIGGFPADTRIQIIRDGENYTIVNSNETGYIDWTYSGGYSEHTFETTEAPPVAITPVTLTISSASALNSVSENATNTTLSSETQYTGMGALYTTVRDTIISGYRLASLIILIFGAFALLRYLGYV